MHTQPQRRPLRDEDSLCNHQDARHRDPDRAGTVSPLPKHPQLGLLTEPLQPDNVVIPFQDLIFRDIRVRGSLISSPREAREMLKLVAEHGISVTTNAFNGLGEIEELVRLAGSGKMKGKGIIVMDAGQIGKEREKVGGGEVA